MLTANPTTSAAASVAQLLIRLRALLKALRIISCTWGLKLAEELFIRLSVARWSVPIVSEIMFPDCPTREGACSVMIRITQYVSPSRMPSSTSTSTTTEMPRRIFSLFCAKEITGWSIAASGMAITKGESLSQTWGTAQKANATRTIAPIPFAASRSAAFLSSLMLSLCVVVFSAPGGTCVPLLYTFSPFFSTVAAGFLRFVPPPPRAAGIFCPPPCKFPGVPV